MKKAITIMVIISAISSLAGAAATITFDGDSITAVGASSVSTRGLVYNSSGDVIGFEGAVDFWGMSLAPGTGISDTVAVYNTNGYFSGANGASFDLTGAYFKSYDGIADSLLVQATMMDNLGNITTDSMEIDLTDDFAFSYFGWSDVFTVNFMPIAGGNASNFLLDNVIINDNSGQYAPAIVPVPSAVLLASGGMFLVGYLKKRRTL